jgi:hypothetical protein
MKYLITYENFELDDILDKITDSGMDSLTYSEKDYLNNYSDKLKNKKSAYTEISTYDGQIGPYDAFLKFSTKTTDEWYGTLTVDDKEYKGYITFDDSDNIIAIFDSEDSDVYTDFEGLEHEIFTFIEDAYFYAK